MEVMRKIKSRKTLRMKRMVIKLLTKSKRMKGKTRKEKKPPRSI
jgi:hypothetical protein